MRKFSVLKNLASVLGLTALASLAPAYANPADSALIDQYAQGLGQGAVSQVSSVSELSDVDPNSWAFQALKSVVERYGCLEGYPSKVYLGNKALTRYEFAAGLNACLEKVNELIAAASADKATKDDLAVLERLQDEFKTELGELRGRVDNLEAKIKDLESKQFSTTTKLDGSVVMAVTGGGTSSSDDYFTSDAVSLGGFGAAFGDGFSKDGNDFLGSSGSVSGSSANTTFVARTTLNFRTSFTGNDELLIRARGVTGQDISSSFPGISSGLGTLFYAGTFDGSTSPVATNGNAAVTFDKVRYTTTLGDSFRIFVGPRIDIFEFVDTNSFANNEEVDFSNGFFINNPLITFVFAGPGGGFDWELNDAFSVRGIYIAGQGGNSLGAPEGGSGGFTGGNNIFAVEAELRAGTAKLKLQAASFNEQVNGYATGTGAGGTLLGNPSAFGDITESGSLVGGINAEWAVTDTFGIFGRYGFGKHWVQEQVLGSGIDYNPYGENEGFNSSTWAVGASIGDLLVPGSTLGLAFGQPIRARGQIRVNGDLVDVTPTGTEFNAEVFYNFPLNDRITLTPDLQIISNPSNISGNPTITVGSIRAVFTF